jgi:cation:H+ antiporter
MSVPSPRSLADRLRHPCTAVAAAVFLTLPWVVTVLTNATQSLSTVVTVAISGVAILGAAFLLAWAAEIAEKDVPTAFAIAVLAVLAVAPEYAVDALFAWQAGIDPGPSRAASLAIANMTGANRILIGIGWSGIALFTLYRAKRINDSAVDHRPGFLRDAIELDHNISTEIVFLLAATAYAFFIPLGGGIGMVDTIILVSLYILYIIIIIRDDGEEHTERVGVPAYFQAYPKPRRIVVVLFLFSYSGILIYTAVHPFAHGLVQWGTALGIPPFFMVQWIAPLASECPELIIVAYLVNKARSTAGFNALISSKLNQWTLLIGTLAVVYSIAAGHIGGLPLGSKQVAELWITAAQSFFALAMLTNFEITAREAVSLLVLFVSQVAIEFVILQTLSEPAATALSINVLYAYILIYMVGGFWLFARRSGDFRQLIGRATSNARKAIRTEIQPESAD